ncbi:SGNH hydrolase domain-containing protein [Kocuria oceani]|uniref:SGNH hydrolase domain-containing protein n=1 Tax=Kocuria oceani TaxID=988827 RepID=A0ABV9TJT1_9MICC
MPPPGSQPCMRWLRKGAIRLDVNTKSSCTTVDVPASRNGQPYHSCELWRAKVTERLVASRPDVVLLANRSNSPNEDGSLHTADQWNAAVAETVRTLSEVTEVGVVADVPDMGATPAICLSAHLENAEQCVRPRAQAFVTDLIAAEQAATESSGGTHLNLNDHLCNAAACPVIVGNHLIYRDAHHLTATFGESLHRPLAREMAGLID